METWCECEASESQKSKSTLPPTPCNSVSPDRLGFDRAQGLQLGHVRPPVLPKHTYTVAEQSKMLDEHGGSLVDRLRRSAVESLTAAAVH